MSEEDLEIGPIDYLVVEYPESGPTGEALPHLLDVVRRGIIRVLDMAIIVKGEDSNYVQMELADVTPLVAAELGLLDGATTGLLDDDDLAEAASVLLPGRIGAVLVYENTWAAPFATALRRAGGEAVAGGRVPVQDILDTLDAIEELEATEEV